MKKRILSIAICLCLMLSLLNIFDYNLDIYAEAATARTLTCTCGAGGTTVSASHYLWCELFCVCDYATDSSKTTHSEEKCPCFSCADSKKSQQWRGCTASTSGTTSVTASDGKTYAAKGTVTHSNQCMKFSQSCTCSTKTEIGSGSHTIGCPFYTLTKNSSGNLNPTICATCGWLFGEHYRYCTSSANTQYLKYSEVQNRNVYFPGFYTKDSTNGGVSTTITLSNIDTFSSTYGITFSAEAKAALTSATYWDSDAKVITDNTKKNICFKRLKNGNQGKFWDTEDAVRDIHIPQGVVCVIDLNGNRIIGQGTGPAITNYGTLIIVDSNPTVRSEGQLEDRGYYYFDDQSGKYFHSIRNAEDAIWKQGVTYNKDENGNNTTPVVGSAAIFGGIIYGGRTTRNVAGVGYVAKSNTASTLTIDCGKTYDELVVNSAHYSNNLSANQTNTHRYYFTYLIENNQIGNRYGFGGGGIHNTGTVVMDGGTIAGCESMNGEGSAVYSTGANASFTLNSGSIRYNFGKSTVATENGATTTINGGLIYRNVAIGNGAIRGETEANAATKTTLNIGNSGDPADDSVISTVFANCTHTDLVNGMNKTSENGTTVGVFDVDTYNAGKNITTPVIAYNRALAEISTDGNGGGIYAENVNLNLNAAVITENWAHYRGGGIDIFEEGNVTLSGNILIKNNYCEYKGGGIAVRNSDSDSTKLSLTINSDTVKITGNKAGYGGGIYHSYGNFNMSAGELSDNESVGYYISCDNYNALSFFSAIDEDQNDDNIRDLVISAATQYDGDANKDMYNSSMAGKDWGYPELLGSAKTVDGYRTCQAIGFDGSVTDVSFAPRIAGSCDDSTGEYKITSAVSLRTNASGGGGAYIEGDANTNVTISNTAKITGNHASNHGGAIYLNKGTVAMSGGAIDNNYINGKEYTHTYTDTNGTEVTVSAPQYTYEGQFKGSVDKESNAYNGNKNGINDARGGAVCIQNGQFTMSGGTINGNMVLSKAGDGAGIYIVQNTENIHTTAGSDYAFKITGGEIAYNYNYDDQGGGICSEGKVVVGGGTIHDNRACDNGGGIYCDGTVEMTGGKIYNNTANAYIGGGVYAYNGSFTMSGGEIYQNQTLLRNGGGVYVRNGNFTMSGGKIYENKATQNHTTTGKVKTAADIGTQYGSGGGVCIQNGDVTITGDSKIYNNSAVFKGGGIYMFRSTNYATKGLNKLVIGTDTTDTSVAQPVISGNTVNITSEGSALTETTDSGAIHGGYLCGGGAICVEGGLSDTETDDNIIVYNATIKENTVSGERTVGGGIFALDRAIANDTNESNENAASGPARILLKNVTANENQSINDQGGFLYVYGSGEITLSGGTYDSNVANDNGGFAFVADGNLYIRDNAQITNNTAKIYIGGAVHIARGNVYLYSGNIEGNKTTNQGNDGNQGHGGAVSINVGNFTMYNGTIINNKTGKNGNGGAVSINETGSFTMYGGTLSGNTTETGNGGAVYVNKGYINIGKAACDGTSDDTHNTLDPAESSCGHPIITANTAVNGGALYTKAGTTTFYCGSMTANTATNKGGGMYVEGGTVTISNAGIKGNSAAEEYYGDALYMAGGTVKYTDKTVFQNSDNTNTGVVVAGGTFEQTEPPATALISVYFKDRESEKVVQGFTVPAGTNIVLPDGNDIFGTYEGHTFIGWQYPDVSDYVRNDNVWHLKGAQITTQDNSMYVEGAVANTMTIYGVWANDENTITYYKSNAENSADVYTGTGYLESYTYQTTADNKFTLPTPTAVLDGYTFTGWTMQQGVDCKNNCNANWNISAGGDAKAAGEEFNTKSKFGNIHFVANWSTTITYKAIGGGKVDGALQKTEAITVGNTTTDAQGATAAPDLNYVFMGWYTDEDCTQKVAGPTDTTYVPTTNGGSGKGYYENLTYYAKFELDVASLTIKTTGADANQTFVFTVEGKADHGGEQINMQVFVFSGADGNGSVTIEHIPAGTYTVYENNIKKAHQGDKWTWRYTDTGEVQSVVNTKKDGAETDVDTVTYSYSNNKGISNWLSGLSTKLYRLLAGN